MINLMLLAIIIILVYFVYKYKKQLKYNQSSWERRYYALQHLHIDQKSPFISIKRVDEWLKE